MCENAKNTHFKDLVADDAFYKQRKEPIAVYCKYGDEGYKELENFVSWTDRDEGVKKYLDHLCSDDSIEKDEKDIKLKSIFMIESYKELIKTKYGDAFKVMVDRNGNLYDDPFFKLQQGGLCKKAAAQPVSPPVTELARPAVAVGQPQAAAVQAKEEQLAAKVEPVAAAGQANVENPPVKVENQPAAAEKVKTEQKQAPVQVVSDDKSSPPPLEEPTVTTKTPVSAPASSVSAYDPAILPDDYVLYKDVIDTKYKKSDLDLLFTGKNLPISVKGNLLERSVRAGRASAEDQEKPLWFSSKKNKNKK